MLANLRRLTRAQSTGMVLSYLRKHGDCTRQQIMVGTLRSRNVIEPAIALLRDWKAIHIVAYRDQVQGHSGPPSPLFRAGPGEDLAMPVPRRRRNRPAPTERQLTLRQRRAEAREMPAEQREEARALEREAQTRALRIEQARETIAARLAAGPAGPWDFLPTSSIRNHQGASA